MATTNFFHGVRFGTVKSAPSIILPRVGVIAMWGTASGGTASDNKPYLVESPEQALELFGDPKTDTGTLAKHLAVMYEIGSPKIVVIKGTADAQNVVSVTPPENGGTVEGGEAEEGGATPRNAVVRSGTRRNAAPSSDVPRVEALPSVVGDRAGGAYTGLQALRIANSLGYEPEIYIAPYFTENKVNADALISIASDLGAFCGVDMPNETKADAIKRSQQYGSNDEADSLSIAAWPRFYRTFGTVRQELSLSAVVAAVMGSVEYFESPSNKPISNVIEELTRPVSWSPTSSSNDALDLNENRIVTVINDEGFKIWGNRSLAALNSEYSFISVKRIDKTLRQAIRSSVKWAIDKGITRAFGEEVTSRVNAFLRLEKARGAIIGGDCFFRVEDNQAAGIKQGKTVFGIAYTPAYPNEDMLFNMSITERYIEEIF